MGNKYYNYNIKPKNLYGITPEEFVKKCNEANNNDYIIFNTH